MTLPFPSHNLDLEKLALGELNAEDAARLREELGHDAVEAHLAELRLSNAQILQDHPPGDIAHGIKGRLRTARARREAEERTRRRNRLWLGGALITSVAAILLLIFYPAPPSEPTPADEALAHNTAPPPPDDIIRHKSSTRLGVFRKTEGGAERLASGDLAQARDVLQLRYTLPEKRYGLIFSIDGRGTVTPHLPVRGAAFQLEAGSHALDFSYTLDDAPGYERFFFLSSTEPIDVPRLLEQARRLARDPERARTAQLSVPDTLHAITFLVTKP